MSQSELSKIPGVDTLLSSLEFPTQIPEPLRKYFIRSVLSEVRERVRSGEDCPPDSEIEETVLSRSQSLMANRIRSVLNATGVVLHTNLGRAPYPDQAVEETSAVTSGYSNLEIDLDSGDRGGRGSYAETLLTQLTGATAATVVNNCSSALVLTLKCLSEGREVLISRGELVQIGGGFRIPEILEVSGANLCEVGTTNRTDMDDYREAIGPDTGMILRVHRSNFDVVGFTETPSLEELRGLADERDIPLVCDLGSGALVDTSDYGLRHERQPNEVLEDGADLVMFSGDKLLGGPQTGVILGGEEYVNRLRNHPLFRALRTDKSILTALESVLTMYATDRADELPVYRMFSTSRDELRARAKKVLDNLDSPEGMTVEDTEGAVGGGALPSEEIPSASLKIKTDSPEQLMPKLRSGSTPVVGRIKDGDVLLDFLTLLPEDDERLVEVLNGIEDISA